MSLGASHRQSRSPIDEAIEQASALQRLGHLSDADVVCRQILSVAPDRHEPTYLLGVLMLQRSQTVSGATFVRRALAIEMDQADAHFNLAISDTLAGKVRQSAVGFRRTVLLSPQYGGGHQNLANTLAKLEAFAGALFHYRIARILTPDFAEAYGNAGIVLFQLGKTREALASYERSIIFEPSTPDSYSNLGLALVKLERLEEAVVILRRALHLSPGFAAALANVGLAYIRLVRPDLALRCLRRALALAPADYDVCSNLGGALALKNLNNLGIAYHRRRLAIRPDDRDAHTNLIFAFDFVSGVGIEEQQAERRRWYARHAEHLAPVNPSFGNSIDPDRKLRIGYVSADFRGHSAAFIIGGTFLNHDRSQFDVVAYSNVEVEDEMTASFRGAATLWRSTVRMSDVELAEQIRSDAIDILVDLSGHTLGHRLLVFARKPAPLQVTAWGHVTGTGLKTIDYLFADPVLVPVEARPFFAETIFDLPAFMSYSAPAYVPEEAPYVPIEGRPVIFGCFNRISKISEETFDLWSRLLLDLPNARLIIKDGRLSKLAEQELLVAAFKRRGVTPSRIILRGYSSHTVHLASYGEVDVCLDPFPQNGGTSSLEALWMGVPVVALLGQTPPSRASAALLLGAGFPNWVAKTPEQYLDIAKELARSPDLLSRLRKGLRRRMRASPVGGPLRYCRAVEAAYRQIWRAYCGRMTAR